MQYTRMGEYFSSAAVRRLHHPLEESPLWPMLGSVVWSILAFVIGFPVLILFALLCPICMAVKWISETFGSPEKGYKTSSQIFHTVLVFSGKIRVKTLQELVLYRVIPRYPKLTYKPSTEAGPWIADPKFHISNHVYSVANSRSQDSLLCLETNGLTPDKPPWELQVFENNGETMAVFRYHQNLAEFHVLVNLLCTALADNTTSYIEVNNRKTLHFCIELIKACIVAPLTVLLWILVSTKDHNLLTNKPLWTGRIHATWSSAISLAKVTRIKQVTRSTTNCVMLSTLAGSIRNFLQNCGIAQPPDMQVLIPISQFGSIWPVVVPLAVGTEGAVPRIWDSRAILRRLKSNSEPLIGFLTMSALLSVIPERRAYSLLKKLTHHKASVQFSSVIGPESSLLVGGCHLKGIYAILPPQSEIGIAVSVITYAGKVYVTILSDTSLATVATVLLHHLKSQIDVLDNLLKNRRVPNEKKEPIYKFRNVAQSPIKELAHRLNHIQHEILRITDKSYPEESCDNLNMLKAEFTYVLQEIQRRKLSHHDDVPLNCSTRRTVSYPFIQSVSPRSSVGRPRSALPSSPYSGGYHDCNYPPSICNNFYSDIMAQFTKHIDQTMKSKVDYIALHEITRDKPISVRRDFRIDITCEPQSTASIRRLSFDTKKDELTSHGYLRRHSTIPLESTLIRSVEDITEVTVPWSP